MHRLPSPAHGQSACLQKQGEDDRRRLSGYCRYAASLVWSRCHNMMDEERRGSMRSGVSFSLPRRRFLAPLLDRAALTRRSGGFLKCRARGRPLSLILGGAAHTVPQDRSSGPSGAPSSWPRRQFLYSVFLRFCARSAAPHDPLQARARRPHRVWRDRPASRVSGAPTRLVSSSVDVFRVT
jgi:hypothetical protein